MKLDTQTKIWAGMLTLYLVWGSTYLAIRFAVETLPPFLMAGVRFLIAGGILYAWRILSGDAAPTARQWRSAAVVGLFLLLGGNGGVSWAEQKVPSSIAALLIAATPLWIVLVEVLLPSGRSRVNWVIICGVLLGFSGIVVLVGPSEFQNGGQPQHLAGILVIMLAALSWAIGSVYGRSASLPKSTLLGVSMQMIAGGVGLLLVSLVSGDAWLLDLTTVSARSVWGLVYLIVVGALIGYVAYGWLLRNAPLSLVSTYAYVNPIVAVLLGAWLAAEPLNVRVIVASAIIVSAVILINHGRARLAKAALQELAPAPESKPVR